LITSAADAAIFSKIAGRDPGPKSWQRLGRAGAVGWMRKLMTDLLGNLIAISPSQQVLNCAALCKDISHLQHGLANSPARERFIFAQPRLIRRETCKNLMDSRILKKSLHGDWAKKQCERSLRRPP
jgi:hypothetical protein